VLEIVGVVPVLRVDRVKVIFSRLLGYKTRIGLVNASQGLYYLDQLVVVAHHVELLLFLRKHFLAGREWEAGGAREEHTREVSLVPHLINVGNIKHFGQNATDTPHVDASVVLGFAQNNFWRAVPSRDNLVRQRPLGPSIIR